MKKFIKTQPGDYRLAAVAPRNSGTLRAMVRANVLPSINNTTKFTGPMEWYNDMEMTFGYDRNGQIVKAELQQPQAHERLHLQQVLQGFSERGFYVVPQTIPPLPPQTLQEAQQKHREAEQAKARQPGKYGQRLIDTLNAASEQPKKSDRVHGDIASGSNQTSYLQRLRDERAKKERPQKDTTGNKGPNGRDPGPSSRGR